MQKQGQSKMQINMIASERRRAEVDREMRNRDYNDEDDEPDDNGGDGGETTS